MDAGEILAVCSLIVYFILLAVLFCGWHFYLHETKRKNIRHHINFDVESYKDEWDFTPGLSSIGIKDEAFDRLEDLECIKYIPKID